MSVKLFSGVFEYNVVWWTFPAGERSCRIADIEPIKQCNTVNIGLKYESSSDLIDTILLVNALRQINPSIKIVLDVPYMPFGRQDRAMTPGEPNAIQAIAAVLTSLNFSEIITVDPHSDVMSAVFPPGVLRVVSQEAVLRPLIEKLLFKEIISSTGKIALVSPDAGATKKIHKVAKNLPMLVDVVEARKVRDVYTGMITSTSIDAAAIADKDALIVVDDICDGGRTFVELAKAIAATGYAGKLILLVTHGIFSNGIDVLLEHYDYVECYNDMQKEKKND